MRECPVCGIQLTLNEGIEVGELLECNECSSELEILSTQPLGIGRAPQEQEDWGE